MTRSLFLCGFQDAYNGREATRKRTPGCRRTGRRRAVSAGAGRKAGAANRMVPRGQSRRKLQGVPRKRHTISGGNGWRVPPVPIPNTAVKPPHADGTWLETARESRSLPDSNWMLEKQSLLQHPNNIPHPAHIPIASPHSNPISAFLSSSMAEHSAVNRRVVGSSPT